MLHFLTLFIFYEPKTKSYHGWHSSLYVNPVNRSDTRGAMQYWHKSMCHYTSAETLLTLPGGTPTSTLRFRDSGHGRVHGHWTVSLHTRFNRCTFPVEQPVDTSKPAEDAHGASSTSKSDPFPFTDAKLALIALARRKLLPSAHVNH